VSSLGAADPAMQISAFASAIRQPDGQINKNLSSPSDKNISLNTPCKSAL
jgi:hypothetical protein